MKKAQAIRLAVLVVGGAVVLGGAWIYRVQRSASQAAAMLTPATELVRSADIYFKEQEFVEGLIAAAHAEAVGVVGSAFSQEKYYTAMLQSMVNQAKAAGREDVGRSLRTFAVGRGYVDVTF